MLGDTLCSPCTSRHPRHEPATCSKYSNTYSSKETVKRGKVCHSLLEGELLTLHFSCFQARQFVRVSECLLLVFTLLLCFGNLEICFSINHTHFAQSGGCFLQPLVDRKDCNSPRASRTSQVDWVQSLSGKKSLIKYVWILKKRECDQA